MYICVYVKCVLCVCISLCVYLHCKPSVMQYLVRINSGNVSKVLPDYEKSHVMSLIISYIPEHSADNHSELKYVCMYCM